MSQHIREAIEALQRKAAVFAEEQGEPVENSWDALAEFLIYLAAAGERVPGPAAIAATSLGEIDQMFSTEIEHLAVTVMKIFPRGGFEEFSTYLKREE